MTIANVMVSTQGMFEFGQVRRARTVELKKHTHLCTSKRLTTRERSRSFNVHRCEGTTNLEIEVKLETTHKGQGCRLFSSNVNRADIKARGGAAEERPPLPPPVEEAKGKLVHRLRKEPLLFITILVVTARVCSE